jgi:hypothetical protein
LLAEQSSLALITVAAVNAPAQCVASGPSSAIEELRVRLIW